MSDFDQELKKFVCDYNPNDHNYAKQKMDILFKKYPRKIKLFKTVGMLFLQNNKLEDAKNVFKKVLDLNPNTIDILINLGLIYYELRVLDKAEIYLQKAEKLNNKSSEVFYSLGLIYEKKKNLTNALIYYKKAINVNNDNTDALINLGNIYSKQDHFYKAQKAYEKALRKNPNNSNIHHNLGVALTQLGKIEEAIECYIKSEKLDSKNPLTYYNLGVLYSKKFEYQKATLKLKKAISLQPNIPKFFYNLAEYVTKLGQHKFAIENYKKTLSIKPDHLGAKYNLSRLNLATENFKEGWKNFHLRFEFSETQFPQKIKDKLNLNQWNGEKFDGTLYVHGEQGVGDQILHSSMIQDLYKRHSDICLIVDERLLSLFKRSFEKIKIAAFNSNLKFKTNDKHILLASLGKLLRKSINYFKEKPPSFIIPSNEKIAYYRKNLSNLKRIKIGLSWKTTGPLSNERFVSLERLSKIITNKDFEIINLQYGNTIDERKFFENNFKTKIININNLDLKNDFEGLAALISNCDLILTISNVTAHLAGSIGKNTWVMVPVDTQWHWFTNRTNSLWYPNLKLFRQNNYGIWDNILNTLYIKLINEYQKLT